MLRTRLLPLTPVLCILLLCVPLARGILSADDSVTVRVGLYENPPKIFTDAEGRASGFWPDLINYIALQEDWNIQYVPGSWTECLDRLSSSEIDMMPDVAYTAERGQSYRFGNEVVYTSWATVYAKEDSNILSVLDLGGKTVAILTGSVTAEGPGGIKELVKAFNVDCTFIEADSYAAVFELVSSGQADAGVTSKDLGYQYKADFDLAETPIIFQPSLLYFAFPKDSGLTQTLLERTDVQIELMESRPDSFYFQSLRHWFAQELPSEPIIPAWLIVALAIVLGMAIVLAMGDYVLRSQVNSRTGELTQEIARRKEAEQELGKSYANMEDLVRERTRELEQANLHKSQFLANMSHELRTPLNSIIGYTKLMLDGMEGAITGDQKEDLQTVYDNSKHLLSLINDLLDLSKIEAGKFEITKDEFPVSDLISQIVPSMQKLASDKGLELTWSVTPDVDHIYADKNKTKQILFNLLGNAVKFTRHGSVRLDIAKRDGEFVFSVTDTGVGMSQQDVATLFQSYRQVGPARLDGSEGTGLGLVISKQFVELQGGRIWVESEPGKGSTFAFTLPVKQAAP